MGLDPAIDRTGAGALIPEEVSREIVQGVPKNSAALTLMRKLPNMSRRQRRLPVLSVLPTAYFVDGDIGQKKTTNMAWKNKFINAEELAVIVPIPEAVLDDQDYDIWGEIRPRLLEAFGIAIDQAIFFGTNSPASWPENIRRGCWASGNVVALGTGTDIADDIGDTGGIMAAVEADGYDVNGFVADVAVKAMLRGLRATTQELIFQTSLQAGTPATLYGEAIEYIKTGMWINTAAASGEDDGETGGAWMIGGDFQQAVFAMRKDITYMILREAVIQDTDGSILYNLAQQDMVALRAVMRLGWQIPNPINRLRTAEYPGTPAATGEYRYPFAALTRPATV